MTQSSWSGSRETCEAFGQGGGGEIGWGMAPLSDGSRAFLESAFPHPTVLSQLLAAVKKEGPERMLPPDVPVFGGTFMQSRTVVPLRCFIRVFSGAAVMVGFSPQYPWGARMLPCWVPLVRVR